MSFIVGLWTVEAHLIAVVDNYNNSAKITGLVLSSQLPRNISSHTRIYCRAGDIHFVTLNLLRFQKVRTSQCKTLPSHLHQWCWPTLPLQARTPGWKISSGKSNFHWHVLELQLLLFWNGGFFVWKEDLFPTPNDQHHYIGFGSLPPTHPSVGCVLVQIKV